MKRIALSLLLLIALAIPAHAQQVANSFDPCVQYPKKSVSVQISTATTTNLVTQVANVPIYVCSLSIQHPGGTGTMALEYGTKVTTACDTGATILLAAFAYNTTAGSPTNFVYPSTEETGLMVPQGDELCALSTGTIVQVVTVTYVQQ